MSYTKHVSEVNKLAKMMNVSNADVFALVQGTLKELTSTSQPDVNDVTAAMVSYVEKFVKISEMIQSNPELLKLTQENVLGSFSNIKWWEK